MYKISIILPVFNVEHLLNYAFDSIYNQSFNFEELEVIFVDDASTDSSGKIIDELSQKYENVKSIHLDSNSGYAGKPRNVGIKNATADYLMFLDPDDEFLPDACSTLYNFIHENELDFVSGNYTITNNGIDEIYDGYKRINLKNDILKIESIDEEPELFTLPPSVWSKIVKKEFVLENDITFPVGIPGQDLVFVYNCFLNARGIGYINEPIIRYAPRLTGEKHSVTAIKTKKHLLGYAKAYHGVNDLYKNGPKYTKYFIKHLNFWSKKFILSDLSKSDKLDLLIFISPIFQSLKKNEDIKIGKSLKQFYRLMFDKKFIDAVNSCDLLSLNFYDYMLDVIKQKDICIIINGNDNGLLDTANLLTDHGFNVNLINLSDEVIETSLNVINLKNHSLITDNMVKVTDNELDFELNFDSLNDYYDYSVSQICLKSDEKVFLIDSDNLINIDESLAYVIRDLKDIKNWEGFLRKIYIMDIKKESNDKDKLISLKKENKNLKQQNTELMSSKSWKITKPLRNISKLKRK